MPAPWAAAADRGAPPLLVTVPMSFTRISFAARSKLIHRAGGFQEHDCASGQLRRAQVALFASRAAAPRTDAAHLK
jgi:hypothetical protein